MKTHRVRYVRRVAILPILVVVAILGLYIGVGSVLIRDTPQLGYSWESGGRPKPAVLFYNSSGAYLRLQLYFDEEVWVDGVAVTSDAWIAEGPMTDSLKAFIINYYLDDMVPIKAVFGPGRHELVINVSDRLPRVWYAYPVWRGVVVIGDKTVKLEDIGKIKPVERRVNRTVFIAVEAVDVLAPADRPYVLNPSNYTNPYKPRIEELFSNGRIDEIVEVAREVLGEVVRAIKNGSLTVGFLYSSWGGTHIIAYDKRVVGQYIDSKRLVIWVEVAVDEWFVNATVVTPSGIELQLRTWRHLDLKLSSAGGEPKVEYYERLDLSSAKPIPYLKSGAVIVFYRKTPYSPYNVLVTTLNVEDVIKAG